MTILPPGSGPGAGAVAGPPPSPRRRRPRWQRVIGWISIGLAVILIAGAGTVVFLAHRIEGKITVQKPDIIGTQPAKVATKAENFLLIGSDSRAGANGKGTGGSAVSGQRSDTTILLHISADDAGATLVSIPRDSYVQIPSCVEPDGQHSQPFMSKFNAAFAVGGASCTISTVQHLTGIKVDHYAIVDFVGFKKIVEALGGVRMCVAYHLYDPVHYSSITGGDVGSGLNLPKGQNVEINGQQALDLMRAREALDNGGDLPRIKRQQEFIGAMIRKVTSDGLLLNPVKLYDVLSAVASSLTTDGFGVSTMEKLAKALHNVGAGGVQLLTVPLLTSNPPSTPYGDVVFDPSQSHLLFKAIRDDTPIPGSVKAHSTSSATTSPSPSSTASTSPSPTTSSSGLVVPPSDITVNVLNGSTTAGAAHALATKLAAQGFTIGTIGNASSSDYTHTVVEYGPDKVQTSQTLAAALPGSTRVSDSSLTTSVTVIIGSASQRVVPVTLSSSSASTSTGSSSTPAPTPTASIPATTASQEGCLS